MLPDFSTLLMSRYMWLNLWKITQAKHGSLYLDLLLDKKYTLTSPLQGSFSCVHPFSSTLFILWIFTFCIPCDGIMFDVIVHLLWDQLFYDEAEMFPKIRPGGTNTVRTLHLSIGNNQVLFIFSKVSLATRWFNLNFFHIISYFNLRQSTLFYLLQELRRCLRP